MHEDKSNDDQIFCNMTLQASSIFNSDNDNLQKSNAKKNAHRIISNDILNPFLYGSKFLEQYFKVS